MATTKASRAFLPFICQSCRHRLTTQPGRHLSTSRSLLAEDAPKPVDSAISGLSNLSNQMSRGRTRNPKELPSFTGIMDGKTSETDSLLSAEFGDNFAASQSDKPHRLHVYAHKHNTHLTFVQPPRSAADTAHLRIAGTKASASEQKKTVDTLLSLSTGNIGFKKAGRGSYDAAFQLTAFALKQMDEKGMLGNVRSLEVILRGFGAGREAVTKALLGTEGRRIRGKISSVVDATRLKQGGARAKKPRRLG